MTTEGVTACDLAAGREPTEWIDRRAKAASRTWTPAQRTHAGDVAWSAGQHDIHLDRRSRVWTAAQEEVVAWARVEPLDATTAYADVHVDPTHADARALVEEVLTYAGGASRATLVIALDRERHLLDACDARGGLQLDGPWFTHLTTDLADRRCRRLMPTLPPGYRIRAVTDGDLEARVEVHRRAWAPARVQQLGRRQDGGAPPGGGSAMSAPAGSELCGFDRAAYERVRATALYRPGLDLVVEAPDGRVASSALAWFDERTRSGLIEPVGTDPSHATRGLARAACAQLLRELARLGAGCALVCPRGDDAYPVPARIYRSLGMHPVARTVSVLLPAG